MPRTLTRTLTAVGVAVLSALLVLPPATSVAEPRRSLADAKAQVGALQHKAEAAAEEYNTARVKSEQIQQVLDSLRTRVQDRQGELSARQRDLGGMAAATYRSGGVGEEMQLLFADDPQEFLRAATALQQVSRRQEALLRRVDSAQRSLVADQRRLVVQESRRAEISATLADRKAEVEKQLDNAQQVLDSLEAEQRARLEAQRRAAAAREAAEAREAQEAQEAREAREARASRASRRDEASGSSAAGSGSDSDSGSGGGSGSGSGSGSSDGSGSGSGSGGGSSGGSSGAASAAVEFAYDQLGDSYGWGAAGPDSWDCSGLTMGAWDAAGVSLPHSSSMQYDSGRKVSRSQLRPGDLVFYYSPISHVGIYVGNGQIIHAPNSSEPVKTDPVGMMPYTGAVRP